MTPSAIITDFFHKVRVFKIQQSNPRRLQLQFILLDKRLVRHLAAKWLIMLYWLGSIVSKAGKARAHTAEDCMYGLTHKVECSSCDHSLKYLISSCCSFLFCFSFCCCCCFCRRLMHGFVLNRLQHVQCNYVCLLDQSNF